MPCLIRPTLSLDAIFSGHAAMNPRACGPTFFFFAMTLTDEQKAIAAGWIESGASLSDVQKRLREEFQISLTYLDTRLLVDDLKITIKEPEPEPVAAEQPTEADLESEADLLPPAAAAGTGSVKVTIDQIVKPGALISGGVTFSDGESADWYLDQTGRLALNPSKQGYRPTEKDVLAFQVELQRLARSQGY